LQLWQVEEAHRALWRDWAGAFNTATNLFLYARRNMLISDALFLAFRALNSSTHPCVVAKTSLPEGFCDGFSALSACWFLLTNLIVISLYL
jgi:hypothetical protein